VTHCEPSENGITRHSERVNITTLDRKRWKSLSENMIGIALIEVATSNADASPAEGETAPDETGDDRDTAKGDAAKCRRQLREVEAQRDQLGEGLALSALLDDDGNLDPAKVATRRAARKVHPHWAALQRRKGTHLRRHRARRNRQRR
jgi:hypothetical protein